MSLGAKVDKLAALLQTEDKPVVVPSDHEVAKTMIHAIITAVNTNTDLDIADKLAASIRPGLTAKEFVKLWDEGQRAKRLATRVAEDVAADYDPRHPARDHFHFLKATSVPVVPLAAPGPVDANGYYTPQEEERLATIRMKRPAAD